MRRRLARETAMRWRRSLLVQGLLLTAILLARAPFAAAQEPAPEGSAPGRGEAAPQQATIFDPGHTFVTANAAYDEGRYGEAIAGFRALLEHGIDDAHIHYNLGNAYLRHGELGRAVASYLRAQARAPRNQDVVANLGFARKSTKDALAPPTPSPVLETLFFWHYSLSRRELTRAVLLLNLLLWGLLVGLLLRRGSEALRWSAGGVFLLLLALGGSLAVRWALPQTVAVVIPQEIEARSGNSAEDVVRFKLHAGSEVRVVEQRGDWYRISLPDGQQGWVPGEHLEVVWR